MAEKDQIDIFHLSHPRTGGSVNTGMDKVDCSVKYPDFNEAIELCLNEMGQSHCYVRKSDMSMAFHNVPLLVLDFPLMLLKAQHPITGVWYFFIDKCLPFGASISCKIFQDFSDSVAFLVTYRTGKKNVNYLDDFFFAAMLRAICNWQVNVFLDVCHIINFPVSIKKTYWGTTKLTFLGQSVDTENKLICLPIEKINKALNLISYFLNLANKKVKG